MTYDKVVSPRVVHLSVKKGGSWKGFKRWFKRKIVKPVEKVAAPVLNVVKDVGEVATPFLKKIPGVGQAIELGEEMGLNPLDYAGNLKKIVNAAKHPAETLKKGYQMASEGKFDSLMGDELAAKFHSANEQAQGYYKEARDFAEQHGIDPETLADHFKGYKDVLDDTAAHMQLQGVQATPEDVHRNVPAIMAQLAKNDDLSEDEKEMLQYRLENFSTKDAIAMAFGFDPNGPFNPEIVQACYNANDMTKGCLAPAFDGPAKKLLPGVPTPSDLPGPPSIPRTSYGPGLRTPTAVY